jgi:hypothetical protein
VSEAASAPGAVHPVAISEIMTNAQVMRDFMGPVPCLSLVL